MRWDALFGDLEAQVESMERAERAGEIDDRTRGEVGALRLRDRVVAGVGAELRVELAGGLRLTGVLLRAAAQWWLLDEGAGREAVVAADHVTGVRGLPRFAAVPGSESVVESRLGLRHALRGIARDRSASRLHLVDGSVVDATVDRVGSDFVEVATHAAGELRRRAEVRDVLLVPLAAIVAVRRAAE